MTRAFEDLYGVPNAFDGVPFNGRTDAWILSHAAAAHGIDDEALSRFKPLYLDYLAEELHKPGPRKGVMPGVASAARRARAARRRVSRAADGQLRARRAASSSSTSISGATSRAARSATRPTTATACCRRRSHASPPAAARRPRPADIVIIGDTPLDVGVAVAGGARSIAVATGSHTTDELRASGADVVFRGSERSRGGAGGVGAESRELIAVSPRS